MGNNFHAPSVVLSTCTSEQVQIEDKMQRILDKGIEKYGARGTSVAVIFPDNTIWAGSDSLYGGYSQI